MDLTQKEEILEVQFNSQESASKSLVMMPTRKEAAEALKKRC